MKVYVAHNFSARSWLPKVVITLETHGHTCTSTWIHDDAHTECESLEKSAIVDIQDIRRSDCLILFTDQNGPVPGKGKYFEAGVAYALGLPVILVGEDRGFVFCHLPNVAKADTFEEVLPLLKELDEGGEWPECKMY